MQELFILRHGETEWNAAGRMQGGECDSPLTARGTAQAEAMAEALVRAGANRPETALWSSPQGRARATAAPIGRRFGRPFRTDTRLAEIGMGPFAGLTRAEIAARWPGVLAEEHPILWYDSVPGGEGLAALHARAAAFLSGLAGPAILVTHGLTSRMLRAAATGLGPAEAAELSGGQGIIYRVAAGRIERIEP